MTKKDIIDEMLRQGINAKARVKIAIKGKIVIGHLTDAKVYVANDQNDIDRIGFIIEPPVGKINAPIPRSINVEDIDSIEKL